MPEQTDEEIARLVQSGNFHSFGLLMERYQPKLLRYARKFVNDGEEAQDLVQEVFIKAYTNIKSFDADRRFSPWIYRIAHNEFINSLRKKSKQIVFPFDLDVLFPHPVSKETADGDLNRQELKDFLNSHLDKLNPKYREPLVLYYLEELDYKEIAEILEVPVSTVGVRLKRGRTMLKKLMKPIDKI